MRLTLLSLFLIFSYSQAFAELSYVEMTCVEFEHIKETLDYTSDEDLDSDKMPDEGSSAEAVAIIEGYADEETRVEREEKVLFLVDSSYGKYGGCPTKVFENNTGYFESFGDFSTLNMNKKKSGLSFCQYESGGEDYDFGYVCHRKIENDPDGILRALLNHIQKNKRSNNSSEVVEGEHDEALNDGDSSTLILNSSNALYE